MLNKLKAQVKTASKFTTATVNKTTREFFTKPGKEELGLAACYAVGVAGGFAAYNKSKNNLQRAVAAYIIFSNVVNTVDALEKASKARKVAK